MAHWFLWQLAPLYSSCLPHSPSVTLFLAEKSKKEEKWWGFREGVSWETLLAFAERRLIWMQPFLAFNHKWNPHCRGFLWDSSALMLSQVPYLPKPRNSVQARQPPERTKQLGCEFDLGSKSEKSKKGFPYLGKKTSPLPQPNIMKWCMSAHQYFFNFLVWNVIPLKKYIYLSLPHGLSVLHGARKS